MARRSRLSAPDANFHVMSHAIGEELLFSDDHERHRFLKILSEAKSTYGFRLYAYCLMSNHFHLLIRTGATGITEIMQSVLTRYAWLYNERRGRAGYVFRGRFLAPLCTDDIYRHEVVRYIHLNPVKAGVVVSPWDWGWSSHRTLLGRDFDGGLLDVDEVLAWFGENVEEARVEYLKYMARDSDDACERIESLLMSGNRMLHSTEEFSGETSIDQIAADVCKEQAVTLEELRGRDSRHSLSSVRRLFAARAVRGGHKPSEISRYLGRPKSLISRFIAQAREVDSTLCAKK